MVAPSIGVSPATALTQQHAEDYFKAYAGSGLDSIDRLLLIAARLHNDIGAFFHQRSRLCDASEHYQKSLRLRAQVLEEGPFDVHHNIQEMYCYVESLRQLKADVAMIPKKEQADAFVRCSGLPLGTHFFARPLMTNEDIFETRPDSNISSAAHESRVKDIMEDGQCGSAITLFNLAVVRYQLGVSQEIAAQLHELVVDEADRSSRERFLSAWALNNIGIIHFENERYREAMGMFHAALQRIHKDEFSLKENFPPVFLNLSWTFLRMGLVDQAAEALQKAEGAASALTSIAQDDKALIAIGILKAQLHQERGELVLAKDLCCKLLNFSRLSSNKRAAGELFHSLGVILAAQGDLVGAKCCLFKALALRRAVHGHRHKLVADTAFALGRVLQDQNEIEAAISFYEQALSIQKETPELSHMSVIESWYSLGFAHMLQGNLDVALAVHFEAYKVALTRLPRRHALILRFLKAIYYLLRELEMDEDAVKLLQEMIHNCHNGDEAVWVASIMDHSFLLCLPSNLEDAAAAAA